jgi:hypothetical protein
MEQWLARAVEEIETRRREETVRFIHETAGTAMAKELITKGWTIVDDEEITDSRIDGKYALTVRFKFRWVPPAFEITVDDRAPDEI